MLARMKGWVLELLLVPSQPSIPVGSGPVKIFRAAPAYYRYRLALWALKQVGAAAGLIAGIIGISAFIRFGSPGGTLALLLQLLELFAWTAFVVQLPFSLAVLHLDFELRWYILSDRSLRIREGILSLREKTMTFANIQNVEIRQNPLQRILGIADVQVRSAGGGGGTKESHGGVGESLHEATFRGVDNAADIRFAITERVRLHRDSGLGDPDDAAESRPSRLPPAKDSTLLSAARELVMESRRLREALEQ